MLVITRLVGEKVLIFPPGGKPIKIEIVSVRGDRVRIGIEAPQNVLVLREELVGGNQTWH